MPGSNSFRELFCFCPDLEISLDVSQMGFTGEDFESMATPFRRALEDMAHLERGGIANPDEGRQVGHYWLRAPDLAPRSEQRDAISAAKRDVMELAERIRGGEICSPSGDAFRYALMIGIGGSALGPQFISRALAPVDRLIELRFLDNTDPDGIERELRRLGDDLARTLVVVVSKSGSTAETRNGMLEVRHVLEQRGLKLASQAVAITQTGSQLDDLAQREEWLATLPMWDWVGGRTSVMSAVGLFPAALEGVDVEGLLSGAGRMDSWTRSESLSRNPAGLLAVACWLASGGKGAKDLVVLPYKDRLELLSRYLQQLVMESLGKELNLLGEVVNQGLSVYGNKGSTDQHAFVQQLRDGVSNFFVLFVEVLKGREGQGPTVDDSGARSEDYLLGFLLGTRRALKESGRPSMTLSVPDVCSKSVGALIALFERTVGFYASFAGINAYHQPGVEAGKVAAKAVLALRTWAIQQVEAASDGLALEELEGRMMEDGVGGDAADLFYVLRSLVVNGELAAEGEAPFGLVYRGRTTL